MPHQTCYKTNSHVQCAVPLKSRLCCQSNKNEQTNKIIRNTNICDCQHEVNHPITDCVVISPSTMVVCHQMMIIRPSINILLLWILWSTNSCACYRKTKESWLRCWLTLTEQNNTERFFKADQATREDRDEHGSLQNLGSDLRHGFRYCTSRSVFVWNRLDILDRMVNTWLAQGDV